jgi:hypothetical protein
MSKISKNIFLNEPPKKNCEGKLRNILEYYEIFKFFFQNEIFQILLIIWHKDICNSVNKFLFP